MHRVEPTNSSKCSQLESPRRSYDALLFRINESFGQKEKDDFAFAFRRDLPMNILEVREPLKWFTELERREMLSPDDLTCLEHFFQLVSLNSLLKETRCHQARRTVILFFQDNLESQIPGLCLDDKFNQSWISSQQLPKNFIRKCQDLFRGIKRTTFTVQDLSSLFSGGVKLLVNSCRPNCHNLDSVALKILYLSNLIFQRFGEMIIENKDLVKNFLPRSSSTNRRGRSPDVPPEPQALESGGEPVQKRESVDLLGNIKWLVVSIFLALSASIPRLIDWWEKRKKNALH